MPIDAGEDFKIQILCSLSTQEVILRLFGPGDEGEDEEVSADFNFSIERANALADAIQDAIRQIAKVSH